MKRGRSTYLIVATTIMQTVDIEIFEKESVKKVFQLVLRLKNGTEERGCVKV